MKDIIKYIRNELGISQEQFAKLLGTTNITVNRWENGKSVPTTMAQVHLYRACRDNGIDILKPILAQYDVSYLYHGSKHGINGQIMPISRSRCEFGRGFYMGTDPLQPLTLVCNEDKPVMYVLEADMSDLRCLELEVDLEWAMLIAYCRGYMQGYEDTAIYRKYQDMISGYDMVCGNIADDRMYQVLTDFFEERITDAALEGSLSALDLGKQYVAITQKACDNIRIVREHQVEALEIFALRDVSVRRRMDGLALAERAVRQHRREGLYFDEIMRGEKNV